MIALCAHVVLQWKGEDLMLPANVSVNENRFGFSGLSVNGVVRRRGCHAG
jgi:hypothetical protein